MSKAPKIVENILVGVAIFVIGAGVVSAASQAVNQVEQNAFLQDITRRLERQSKAEERNIALQAEVDAKQTAAIDAVLAKVQVLEVDFKVHEAKTER